MNDVTEHVITGGDVLVDTLIAHGVDTAFTVSGESFLAVLEALRRKRNQISLITARHEGGGSFATEAYGKLTGRPAALFVSRGPGATNAAIGVHTAKQDCSPMLLFVGHVPSTSQGREAFQEINQAAMFTPIAKAVLQPNSTDQVAAVTARAITLATSGRPGPVVVILPRDLTDGAVGDPGIPSPRQRPGVAPEAAALDDAARMIAQAQRPLILSGEIIAIQDATSALVTLAEATGAPVMSTYRRQDTFPNEHPSYAGHLEINRLPYQKQALDEADLLIAIGSRMDGITAEDGALPRAHQTFLQIYPDADVLARCQADLSLLSDPGAACLALAERIAAPSDQERRDGLHQAYLASSAPGTVEVRGAVDLAEVAAEVRRQVRPETVILTDGGSFARWIHRFYRFNHPHSQAGPVSGAMGYGVPGAIGARRALPDRAAIAFVGDGGFMMTGQELVTAVEQNIDLLVVVCDNGVHGSILEGQRQRFGADHIYGTRLSSPNFADLARSYGCAAWTVERTKDFAPALSGAMAHTGPSLIHLLTDDRDIAPFDKGPDAV
ncbi:MAG: thiamine pyrophosphate-binding protein [Rhodospirillaceae bacterium]|jgi:acetolactate synthase I/II/III large subunit|nr:thiamine pyrophosphate-binding protein [Rhodospirillaceae bacterium]MBT3491809.1 thiamine pyrophosphate-binding protein [Rhodospirillaceae bacterium]MBT3783135.1 thiamine pyrophosphate-binding protein [Rhodospirillaceae bacterium]MBT3978131.1 thiamine pyrophosphate-binding protein [Rhodospirillaceae bacterium]MBT4565764.1 thiamine pyrophosphate-binding protein [Rhodospirillaceae bacterium]